MWSGEKSLGCVNSFPYMSLNFSDACLCFSKMHLKNLNLSRYISSEKPRDLTVTDLGFPEKNPISPNIFDSLRSVINVFVDF